LSCVREGVNVQEVEGLRGRSLLEERDLSKAQFLGLVRSAVELRELKREGREPKLLEGQHFALVFQKPSTRTLSSFSVAAADQGASTTYLGPEATHFGDKESVKDSARVLGRYFDGIAFRGHHHSVIEELAEHAGVPVWNALTDTWHPTEMLADVMTMLDFSTKPLEALTLCYLGDARNNIANSLLMTGALLGFEVRVIGPEQLWPQRDIVEQARALGTKSGARLVLTEDPRGGVYRADFLYTDVWVSMGEPKESWRDRIELLTPFQVSSATLEATGNDEVRFLHCLPSFHDRGSDLGRMLLDTYHLDALEVTDEVFESEASVVFDQAENRLHSIKALLIATNAR
jgi:ornithine carbamoyltransferase